jgi:hypothetical protein
LTLFLFVYPYVHAMFGPFLSTVPHQLPLPSNPSLFTHTSSLPGRNYSALISNYADDRVLAIIRKIKNFC